jgi:hypothetical protein
MKTKYRFPIYCIAILLLSVVIADTAYWIYITTQYHNFFDMRSAYLSIFPEVLQNPFWLTVLDIWLLGISLFIFIQAAKANYLKYLSVVLAGLSGLLLVWRIFTLM